MKKTWLVALVVFVVSSSAFAETDPPQNTSNYPPSNDMLLASSGEQSDENLPVGSISENVFHEPLFSKNKIHQYLGLGSIGLAGLAVLAPKEEGKSPHHYLAEGAAALGVAAVASGLTIHLNDIHLHNGFRDPDNLHALLATIGALGFVAAVSTAPGDSHPAFGITGAAAMLLGIKLTW